MPKTPNLLLKFFDRIAKAADPSVGQKYFDSKMKGVIVRVDGRSPFELKGTNGFHPRLTKKELIDELTHSRVNDYQQYCVGHFANSGCETMTHLMSFLNNNLTHTNGSFVYGGIGERTSLVDLRLRAGIMPPEGLDFAHEEETFFDDWSFDAILMATGPGTRAKFLEGGLVPNLMFEFNSKLPETVQKDDFNSDKGVLRWLLQHEAYDVFDETAFFLYAGKEAAAIEKDFADTPELLERVTQALQRFNSGHSL